MRQTISGLVAALAVVTASAAPAMACGGGGGLFSALSSCASSCGHAYAAPCGQSYYGGTNYNYSGYQGGYAHTGHYGYERPVAPVQRHFYADHGPSFTGPAAFAPYPTYQDTAINGWQGYRRGYDYGYDGGRYANATNHYYEGAPAWHGPAVYTYRPRTHFRPRYQGYHTSYRYAPRHSYHRTYRFAGPRYHAAPQYRTSGYGHRYYRPLRRLY